jgi:anti-sigma factor RsiW
MGLSRAHPRSDLLRLVEGELDGPARARVEQHLADCPACRAQLAELAQAADSLGAMPAALRRLATPSAASWPAVWARVQRVPVRRMAPQLNLYLSLAIVAFGLAAALPRGLGVQPARATAGANQPPVASLVTPTAAHPAAPGAGQVSTALAAGRLATGAQAMPAPTPVPGVKG